MWNILKWFFSLVFGLIILYIVFVFVRSLFTSTTATTTTTTTTSSGTTNTSTISPLAQGINNFTNGFGNFIESLNVYQDLKNFQGIKIKPLISVDTSGNDNNGNWQGNSNFKSNGNYFTGDYNNGYMVNNTGVGGSRGYNFDAYMHRLLPNVMLFPSSDIINRGNNNTYVETHGYVSLCVVAGCNRQLCISADQVQNLQTDCTYIPAYSCYQQAYCEPDRQTGQCGWRMDQNLVSCLQGTR